MTTKEEKGELWVRVPKERNCQVLGTGDQTIGHHLRKRPYHYMKHWLVVTDG